MVGRFFDVVSLWHFSLPSPSSPPAGGGGLMALPCWRGSWCGPLPAALLARHMAWPSWRGSRHGPLGVAHGIALLAWLMVQPCWRGLLAQPSWHGNSGAATLAKLSSWHGPHGAPILLDILPILCRALQLRQGGTGWPQVAAGV